MASKHNKPVNFRIPAVTHDQLHELVKKWGENRSQAIIRCIERVWQNEIGSKVLPQEKELDTTTPPQN